MQTLEQIVDNVISTAEVYGRIKTQHLDSGNLKEYDKVSDKLAKLREDTIRQLEEYVENEVQHACR